MNRTVVIDVVGLTRALLNQHAQAAPRLHAMLSASANIGAITPALTCSSQSTYLTGKLPRDHGVVANGWYYRDIDEVALWKQSNQLVQGKKIWHLGRERDLGFTCANAFWWFNMNTDVNWSVTPRPLYCADGKKLPDCYSNPAGLRDEYNRRFGQFPLFKFWGPATSIDCSDWIAKSAMAMEESFQPTLQLVYLPHLDYVLQKLGPAPSAGLAKDLAEIDAVCGTLFDFFRERKVRVVVLSEYGITKVDAAIHPNRILRDAKLLEVKTDLGREYLDTGRCRAFAVSDHQISHVYVRNPADLPAVKKLFENVPGIERVLDEDGKRELGLDHARSGELVLLAAKNSWFTYYFWNDDSKAPDYARTVNIHAKPGYDPCEMFFDPKMLAPKASAAFAVAKKLLGFRYLMEVIPLDASVVKGSHGRITDSEDEGPLLMTSEPKLLAQHRLAPTDICSLLLDHVFQD
jgi:predicted AlkP superfamily pyrophosphatase or phosphodiesterase